MKKILSWILVLVWMMVIFYFSDQPDLRSSLPGFWDTVFRKVAHISEFFVLTYFVNNALRESGLKFSEIIILSCIFSLLYAMLDEYHQLFIFKRHGSFTDVGIDSLGIIVFAVLMLYYKSKENKTV